MTKDNYMSDLLCKLWMQLRRILKSGVQFAASTAKTLSKVAINILKDVVKTVDEVLDGVFGPGRASRFLMWAALGFGAYYLLTREKTDDETVAVENPDDPFGTQTPSARGGLS